MLDFKFANYEKFDENISTIRRTLQRSFKNHESEKCMYQKYYPQILKLHMLTELEKACNLLVYHASDVKNIPNKIKELINDWLTRNYLLHPTAHVMEPVLCFRRLILQELKHILCNIANTQNTCDQIKSIIDENIGQMWMESTNYASKVKMYHQAQLYIMNAEQYKPKELFVEKAKLFWKKGEQSRSFKVLELGINDILQAVNGDVNRLTLDDKKVLGEAKLMFAEYNAQSMNVNADKVTCCFKEAIQISETENSYVLLAQHIHRCYSAIPESDKNKDTSEILLVEEIKYFGNSLKHGYSNVYQSMPAMLSIWLDYTSLEQNRENRHSEKMNNLIVNFLDMLEASTFFTAFSQLVGRICHPNLQVFKILKNILIKLIQKYPQQSLWMILPVAKSAYEIRVKRCHEILNDRNISHISNHIKYLNTLTKLLINLTDADVTKIKASKSSPIVTVRYSF